MSISVVVPHAVDCLQGSWPHIVPYTVPTLPQPCAPARGQHCSALTQHPLPVGGFVVVGGVLPVGAHVPQGALLRQAVRQVCGVTAGRGGQQLLGSFLGGWSGARLLTEGHSHSLPDCCRLLCCWDREGFRVCSSRWFQQCCPTSHLPPIHHTRTKLASPLLPHNPLQYSIVGIPCEPTGGP